MPTPPGPEGRYRHAPTVRGEPCPYATWKGTPRECWSWELDGCAKRCNGLASMDRREAQRVAREAGPRIFPRPRWNGGCAWCGDPILHHEGKRLGEINSRRGWHDGRDGEPECIQAFYLHTRMPEQRDFLLRRDGPRCWDCDVLAGRWIERGESDPDKLRTWGAQWVRWYPEAVFVAPFCHLAWQTDLEVDHEIPLWSVAHLPDDERAAYFGPVNLRARCPRCHAAKTKREAAERAAVKAGAPRCGACVVWNGLEGAIAGWCYIEGDRRAAAAPCARFFPKDQLRAALYGRAKAAP